MIPTKLKYDCVLFDLDGTILDTIPLIIESYQYTFMKHLGHHEPESEILAGIGVPLERIFSRWPQEQAEAMINTYMKHNHARLQTHIGLFNGLPRLFERLLDAGVRLGIVTSKRRESALGGMQPFDLEQYFELVLTKEDTIRHKPDPSPLYKAMELMSLSDPARVLYVGDSIHDLLCAKNAGCASAIVDWTRMPKDELKSAGPSLWINHTDDLYDMVVTG